MSKKTTISIFKTTRDTLLDIGSKGESYDDVINRLNAECKELKQKIKEVKTLIGQFPDAQTEDFCYIGENVDKWLATLQKTVREK